MALVEQRQSVNDAHPFFQGAVAWRDPFPLSGRQIHECSRAEIVQALSVAPVLSNQGGAVVARVHEAAVLKYGSEVYLAEARNMRHVQKSIKFRVPAVIDAWEVVDQEEGDDTRTGYLLMEYIEGRLVSQIWPSLGVRARGDIYRQIVEVLHQLYEIHLVSPGPVGGGLSKGPLFTDYGAGPFRTKEDITTWFNERLRVCQWFRRAPLTQPLFSNQFDELVMCHMDIATRNLILDNYGRVWVLDWAHAGGYPVYFDQAVLTRAGDPDFAEGLLEIMGHEFTEEVGKLLAIGFALTTGAATTLPKTTNISPEVPPESTFPGPTAMSQRPGRPQ